MSCHGVGHRGAACGRYDARLSPDSDIASPPCNTWWANGSQHRNVADGCEQVLFIRACAGLSVVRQWMTRLSDSLTPKAAAALLMLPMLSAYNSKTTYLEYFLHPDSSLVECLGYNCPELRALIVR